MSKVERSVLSALVGMCNNNMQVLNTYKSKISIAAGYNKKGGGAISSALLSLEMRNYITIHNLERGRMDIVVLI